MPAEIVVLSFLFCHCFVDVVVVAETPLRFFDANHLDLYSSSFVEDVLPSYGKLTTTTSDIVSLIIVSENNERLDVLKNDNFRVSSPSISTTNPELLFHPLVLFVCFFYAKTS